MEERITEENFIRYCMRHYNNPHCMSIEDFQKDIKIIKYIKRLFSKYGASKKMDAKQCRLILNHITIFYNIFERDAATRILFFRIEERFYKYLKPFLLYKSVLPEVVNGIKTVNIAMDKNIIKELRAL